MFKHQKNKFKSRAKNNQNEIYILNSGEDVLKIPEDLFYKIDISNFSGNYYKKIYEEALEVEQGKKKLKKARQLNFNFELLDEINLDYFKNLEPQEKIEEKEYNEPKKEKKDKIEKKEKELKNENKKYTKKKSKEYKIKKEDKKEASDKTPTKSSKYMNKIKHNRNLNYDSPIKHFKSKSLINYNDIHNVTPDKNKSQLNFDPLNSMKQRSMNENKNYIKTDNNDKYLLKNAIEMMRRQRIKSEEKNNKLKKHKNEPLEIIFEDNSRKKRVISPEINIKRNFNTKFNKILYNLYNIKTNENTDNNSHNNTLNEGNKITNNKTEKSFSTMFNEIKKRQKRKYYFSLLQKKINYLKQINSNKKFNKNNIFINNNNNNNFINNEKYLHFRIKTSSSNIDNNENYNNNFQKYNNTYNSNNNNNNIFNSYNGSITNFNDKNEIVDKASNSPIYKNNNSHKISKVTFNFKYNSNYGDNIGILGSNEQLGNWCQDKILYLKWNYGNIWSNSINVDNSKLENFEFKYIISHEGTIYWEKGYNYLVDFEGIIDEIQYHKKGRFNKYEYVYKKENSELILHCKWNGWEWDDNNNSN